MATRLRQRNLLTLPPFRTRDFSEDMVTGRTPWSTNVFSKACEAALRALPPWCSSVTTVHGVEITECSYFVPGRIPAR